jgi:hypothetical protein
MAVPAATASTPEPPPALVAGVAMVGAGIVHVALAVAARGQGRAVAVLLVAGIAQVAWGAVAVGRTSRRLELIGLLLGLATFGGWAVAVSVGLPLDAEVGGPHRPAIPDVVAALLALVALASVLRRRLDPGGDAAPASTTLASSAGPALLGLVALAGVVAVPAASDARLADRTAALEQEAADEALAASSSTGATPPRVAPYDPARPLDLSGVPRVTPDQEAAAEALVREVLAAQDPPTTVAEAEAAGYRSIGDAFTGEEHLIDWSRVDDGVALDPEAPEALVFDVGDDGSRRLVAVMFLEPPGTRIDDAPAPGGALTRWHLHGDLCLDPGSDPPAVAGITDATGTCPDGLEELRRFPTLHVWLVPHRCGPFSELEGVGTDPSATAGCDHQHG